MTTIDLPTTATLDSVRRFDALRPVEPRPSTSPSAHVTLPRRVDVHRIDAVVAEIAAATRRSNRVVLDGSSVEMIDAAGLDALERAVAGHLVTVADASVALAKTAKYTGHRGLIAACTPGTVLEMAA